MARPGPCLQLFSPLVREQKLERPASALAAAARQRTPTAAPMPGENSCGDSDRGFVRVPHDPAYETVRRVYNGTVDRAPRLIAQCEDVGDVIAALRWGLPGGVR
jgi:hypothetical protein